MNIIIHHLLSKLCRSWTNNKTFYRFNNHLTACTWQVSLSVNKIIVYAEILRRLLKLERPPARLLAYLYWQLPIRLRKTTDSFPSQISHNPSHTRRSPDRDFSSYGRKSCASFSPATPTTPFGAQYTKRKNWWECQCDTWNRRPSESFSYRPIPINRSTDKVVVFRRLLGDSWKCVGRIQMLVAYGSSLIQLRRFAWSKLIGLARRTSGFSSLFAVRYSEDGRGAFAINAGESSTCLLLHSRAHSRDVWPCSRWRWLIVVRCYHQTFLKIPVRSTSSFLWIHNFRLSWFEILMTQC